MQAVKRWFHLIRPLSQDISPVWIQDTIVGKVNQVPYVRPHRTVCWNDMKSTHSTYRHKSLSHELQSKWVSERANEWAQQSARAKRAGWASEWVSGLSKQANGGANDPLLNASISDSFSLMCTGRKRVDLKDGLSNKMGKLCLRLAGVQLRFFVFECSWWLWCTGKWDGFWVEGCFVWTQSNPTI